jgi:hypothetical protein
MSRFIVAMHGQHEGAKLWRLGMFAELHGHDFLVSAHPKERKIRIMVGGAGHMRTRVLEVIRQHFAVICREKQGLDQKEFTFPPNHPDAQPFPFETLMQAERAGEQKIFVGGKVGSVNVREWLDGVTVPEERAKLQKIITQLESKEGKAISYLHIENIEKLEVAMGDKNESNIDLSGARITGGNIASGAGRSVNQSQDSFTQMLQQISDPELRQNLSQLKEVVTGLRTSKADSEDCDLAEDAVTDLVAVAAEPKKEDSKKKAKGALAKLKGLAENFKSVVEYGEKFETIVKWLGPVIGGLIGSAL